MLSRFASSTIKRLAGPAATSKPRLAVSNGILLVSIVLAVVVGPMSQAAPVLAQGGTILQATLMEPNQKTTEVSTDELRQMLQDKTGFVFDARPHMEFSTSHIPGALNVAPKAGVPMSLYVSDVAEIGRLISDKAAPIVLYCNGPFCGKSKRLAEELIEDGYTNVRRYQLGAPTWRALVGVMQIETDGLRYVRDRDQTAWFVDARTPDAFAAGTFAGARNIPPGAVNAAKDDGRLPMEDHNTRVIVFGASGEQAQNVATELAKNAFHNVAYFDGTLDDLVASLGEPSPVASR
jgi:rhodanese-related sulfurtransferase